MRMQQVIVELRLAKSRAKSLTCGTSLRGISHLNIDRGYFALPLVPNATALGMSLDVEQEQIVLIRGTIDPERLRELESQPKVMGVYPDTEVAPFSCHNGPPHCEDCLVDVGTVSPIDCPIPPCDCQPMHPRGCLQDAAACLGADQLWQKGFDGDGVMVGIVDGGILAEGRIDSNLPGLVSRVVNGWPKENWGTIADWRGHGNMLGVDVLGIAPKASLYDIRISGASENGARISNAIAGIHWAIEKYRATGTPQILCCGWGIYQQADSPSYATDSKHPLTRKIVEAMDEGILVLFAAGNGGQCCPTTWCGGDTGPGRSIWGANGHQRVMTVGAVNKDEQLIGYSSQGPAALDECKPDFCAISHFAGYFRSDSGTSAACAIATGVVALLKQVRPTLTQEAIKRLLKSTAKDIGPPGWDRHSGSGIIQAKMAFDSLIGYESLGRADAARIEQLEVENHCLRELFMELALERRMRLDDASKEN